MILTTLYSIIFRCTKLSLFLFLCMGQIYILLCFSHVLFLNSVDINLIISGHHIIINSGKLLYFNIQHFFTVPVSARLAPPLELHSTSVRGSFHIFKFPLQHRVAVVSNGNNFRYANKDVKFTNVFLYYNKFRYTFIFFRKRAYFP